MSKTYSYEPVRVGVIGCGAISKQYLGMADKFANVRVVAAADINLDAAKAKAAEYNVPRACTPEELLADESIELVLNLTIPAAHVPLGLQTIAAGKHSYCEKPLGLDRESGRQLLQASAAKGVRLGSAPDTFLGSGIQTAKRLIDEGAIGTPVACTAFMLGRGRK